MVRQSGWICHETCIRGAVQPGKDFFLFFPLTRHITVQTDVQHARPQGRLVVLLYGSD